MTEVNGSIITLLVCPSFSAPANTFWPFTIWGSLSLGFLPHTITRTYCCGMTGHT